MKKTTLAKSNFELWTLIGRVNHTILQLRQQELSSYKIPVRQLYVLRIIRALGENATLSEVAKQVERETHVISKQAIRMEKDGLIKRTKNTPKPSVREFVLERIDGSDITKSSCLVRLQEGGLTDSAA